MKDGIHYPCTCRSIVVNLTPEFTIDPIELEKAGADAVLQKEACDIHREWYQSFVPQTPDGGLHREEMTRKLGEALAAAKHRHRDMLIRINGSWIRACLPRALFDFVNGLNLWLGDRLYESYRTRGGEDTLDGITHHMGLFECIFSGAADLRKPDGDRWDDERDPWECWVGHVGSEDEARRIFAVMKTVFPAAREELG